MFTTNGQISHIIPVQQLKKHKIRAETLEEGKCFSSISKQDKLRGGDRKSFADFFVFVQQRTKFVICDKFL